MANVPFLTPTRYFPPPPPPPPPSFSNDIKELTDFLDEGTRRPKRPKKNLYRYKILKLKLKELLEEIDEIYKRRIYILDWEIPAGMANVPFLTATPYSPA